MASVVETVVATVRALQAALLVVTGLQLTGYRWPLSETVTNGATYDFVIVGAGTAGSIIANRLTEVPSFNVVLIEAGGDPPLESVLPGVFPVLTNSAYDYNITSINNGYTFQNLKNGVAGLTAGKVLGGTTSIGHLMHIRGNSHDYEKWAQVTNDESWKYENLLEYLAKGEKLEDEEILASSNAHFFGTDGYIRMARQPSEDNAPIFEAFKELGHEHVLNSNDPFFTVGISEPLITIADGVRQGIAEGYLRPLAERPNFHLVKNTQVTKVLFDDNKNAIGVKAVTAAGETITINANLEVILTAGALITPQLLMLSGVGPSQHLSSFNISVISDLPVGQNLQDHIPAVLVHTLAPGEPVMAPANPHVFPVPTTTAYTALDMNQGYPDYQTINLIFPPDNTALIQFCSVVFTYKDEICQKMFDGGSGKSTLLTVNNMLNPESRGNVSLKSTSPFDLPVVDLGSYSNQNDLHNMALYLQDFARIVNTTAFKNLGAELIDLELDECKNLTKYTYDYFKCYALRMSATMWTFSGTASMGPVLDSQLRVRDVQRLRVTDASAMPNPISGNTNGGVVVLAEKAADLIKASYGPSPKT